MLRRLLNLSLTILVCAATLRAQTPAHPVATPPPKPTSSPTPSDPLDALAPNDLTQALRFVKENYVTPSALTPADLDRATLAGLIERLGRGVTLLPAPSPNNEPAPAMSDRDILQGHIGYFRPGALRKSDLADLDAALRNFAAKKIDALILDLRGTAETQDFAMAAEFAKRFARKGEYLFNLQGAARPERVFVSDRAPDYVGLITILIDEETNGAPEVLASVLRVNEKAILIGEPTAGAAVGYSDLSLGGMILRVAVSEAAIGNERVGFPGGVQPDIAVLMPLSTKREIFKESLTKGMSPFVFESDRPHLNEAALLAGTNPEIEAIQESQQRRARGEKPPLHDPVMQRAVDVITSIAVYQHPAGSPP
ncbi:MAG TPA: S41 family peptidase [Chthoniobacterales bacterium]|jgi:hypothetical protein